MWHGYTYLKPNLNRHEIWCDETLCDEITHLQCRCVRWSPLLGTCIISYYFIILSFYIISSFYIMWMWFDCSCVPAKYEMSYHIKMQFLQFSSHMLHLQLVCYIKNYLKYLFSISPSMMLCFFLHETRYDTMKARSKIVERFPRFPESLLSSAQGSEILSSVYFNDFQRWLVEINVHFLREICFQLVENLRFWNDILFCWRQMKFH